MTNPTFLNPPVHFTISQFRAYLSNKTYEAWKPEFPTLHNTGNPSLKQWVAMGATPQERWGGNLNRYYQGLGWHAAPHVVVCPDYVWVLCDITCSGVSVSCWNSETFGIEMVGDYEVGGDDFATGLGAKVRDNAAAVIAALREKFGWGDLSQIVIGHRGLHFHHDCAQDHHACPGSKVTKGDMLARIAAITLPLPEPVISMALPPEPVSEDHITAPAINSVEDIQAALNRLAIAPEEPVDGIYGPVTIQRVKEFQAAHECAVDGWAGQQTKAALEAALNHPIAASA